MDELISIWKEIEKEALTGRISLKYLDTYDNSINNEYINILFTTKNNCNIPFIYIKIRMNFIANYKSM